MKINKKQLRESVKVLEDSLSWLQADSTRNNGVLDLQISVIKFSVAGMKEIINEK